MKAALKLSSGDLSDTEHLAERLALVYGLSEADSLALSQKIDVQHAHIRFLQRQQLDSNTDSDIVSGVRSKSKQTTEVHFGTANMRAHTRTDSLSPSKTAKEIQDELRAKTQGLFRAPQEAAAKAAVASHSGDHGNVYGGANSSDNNGPLELSYEAPFSHKRDYVLPSANVRNEISRKGGWGSQFSPFFGKVTDSPLAGLMNHSRPEPESDTLDIDAIGAPAGFRRDHLPRDITSPSGGHKNGHEGADLAGTDRLPLTSNSVEFLSMYGHFAGEDLEEDDEALGPNGHAQSDITAVPKDIGEKYEQIPGGSNHHSSAREILNPVDASKRPPTPPGVKGTMSIYDTVHNREPDILLDIAVPETSTRSGTLNSAMAVHRKLIDIPSPEIPRLQVGFNPPPLDRLPKSNSPKIRPVSEDAALVAYLDGDKHPEIGQAASHQASSGASLPLDEFPKSNRPKIRPASGDAILVAYLSGGRYPEIAQAASHQALSSADGDSSDSSDSEDNAYYKSPSRDANPIEADVIQRPDGSSRALRAIAADALAAGGHLSGENMLSPIDLPAST
ncbi:hypothetical protein CI102_6391 [Trichoderma harzianum]|nr:hypothetical protein CI102_6391 [Trichoderma harzianum]